MTRVGRETSYRGSEDSDGSWSWSGLRAQVEGLGHMTTYETHIIVVSPLSVSLRVEHIVAFRSHMWVPFVSYSPLEYTLGLQSISK